MKKTTTKKKVVKKEVESPYIASIKIFGRVYTATGSTVKEAIESIKGVGKVGGVCVMTITRGDVKREKILNAGQLFRLFSASRIMHEIAIKNVCSMFSNI